MLLFDGGSVSDAFYKPQIWQSATPQMQSQILHKRLRRCSDQAVDFMILRLQAGAGDFALVRKVHWLSAFRPDTRSLGTGFFLRG